MWESPDLSDVLLRDVSIADPLCRVDDDEDLLSCTLVASTANDEYDDRPPSVVVGLTSEQEVDWNDSNWTYTEKDDFGELSTAWHLMDREKDEMNNLIMKDLMIENIEWNPTVYDDKLDANFEKIESGSGKSAEETRSDGDDSLKDSQSSCSSCQSPSSPTLDYPMDDCSSDVTDTSTDPSPSPSSTSIPPLPNTFYIPLRWRPILSSVHSFATINPGGSVPNISNSIVNSRHLSPNASLCEVTASCSPKSYVPLSPIPSFPPFSFPFPSPFGFSQVSTKWAEYSDGRSRVYTYSPLYSIDGSQQSLTQEVHVSSKKGKKKTTGKTKKGSSLCLLDQSNLEKVKELIEPNPGLADCPTERDVRLYCALEINSRQASSSNIDTKLAVQKALREEVEASNAALQHGLKLKPFVKEYNRVFVNANKEMKRMGITVVTPRNAMRRKEKKESTERRLATIQTNIKKKIETREQSTRYYTAEEEVIDAMEDTGSLGPLFSKIFGVLYNGWGDRRGVRETILTLERAILDGNRPSIKHIPKSDFILDIERDVIPYYRRLVEEFKMNPSLAGLVSNKLVLVTRPAVS